MPRLSPARDYALTQLDARPLPGWAAGGVARPPPGPPADPRDLGLAEQIYAGVVKNLLLLQHRLAHYAGRRLDGIDPLVQKIAAVGLYQLGFLDRVPASAAVDEAVEQAKRFGRHQAAGFVNAVLRTATRAPAPPPPDRGADPAGYARLALSHPPELFERLTTLLGVEAALRFCEHDNREPPTIVRVNGGVGEGQLSAQGVTLTPHAESDRAGEGDAAGLRLFVVSPAKKALLADWARRGLAQAQDPTAAHVAGRCRVEPGQAVLDRCCGLGTKTLQLRDRLGGSGTVVAVDPSRPRCEGLRRLLGGRRIANVAVHCAGWLRDVPAAEGRGFDRALVDVPCSNSGVLARRPEARYAQSDAALKSLEDLQSAILEDTAPAVRPGGLLVYSTCSVWPRENRQRVEAFLAAHAGYTLEEECATLPNFDPDPARYHDGGYCAVLRRI